MHRSLIIATLIAAATATPLQAQGRGKGNGNRKETRTYVDARGRECRETTHYKKNGKDKYDLKCKSVNGKHDDDRWDDDDRDDRDDRDCRYRDNNGRCDVAQDGRWPDTRYPDTRYPTTGTNYPQTLPEMAGAVIFGSGRRTSDVSRWLGSSASSVRYADSDRNGRPERVSWLDGAGRVVQQWIDTNGDGRADQVRLFRNGQLARTIGG